MMNAHTFLYCHVTNIIFIIRRALKLHVLYVQFCGLLKTFDLFQKSTEIVIIFRRSDSECRTNFSHSEPAIYWQTSNVETITVVWQIKTPGVTKLL